MVRLPTDDPRRAGSAVAESWPHLRAHGPPVARLREARLLREAALVERLRRNGGLRARHRRPLRRRHGRARRRRRWPAEAHDRRRREGGRAPEDCRRSHCRGW